MNSCGTLFPDAHLGLVPQGIDRETLQALATGLWVERITQYRRRQVRYSRKSEKAIDVVLFVNGIPVATLELKNTLTDSSYKTAEKQYCRDRSPGGCSIAGNCLGNPLMDASGVGGRICTAPSRFYQLRPWTDPSSCGWRGCSPILAHKTARASIPVLNVAFMKPSFGRVELIYQFTQTQRVNSHAHTSPTVKPNVINADLEISITSIWLVFEIMQPRVWTFFNHKVIIAATYRGT